MLQLIHGRLGRQRQTKLAVIGLLVAIIAAIIGPFGTFEHLSLGQRFAYWLLALGGALPIWWGSRQFIDLFVGRHTPQWPTLALDLTAAPLAAAPLAFLLLLLNRAFLAEAETSYATLYPWVAGTIAAVCLGYHAAKLLLGDPKVAETADEPREKDEPPFLTRVPKRIAGELVALKSEDHYLRVFTAAGDDLILYRLSDAVRELPSEAGIQVHRSYWVSFNAIVRLDRDGRRQALILSNGLRVPVSSRHWARLRRHLDAT